MSSKRTWKTVGNSQDEEPSEPKRKKMRLSSESKENDANSVAAKQEAIKSMFQHSADHDQFMLIFSSLEAVKETSSFPVAINQQIAEYATGELSVCSAEHCENNLLLLQREESGHHYEGEAGNNYCIECTQDIILKLNKCWNSDTDHLSYPVHISLNAVYKYISGLDYDYEIAIVVPEKWRDIYGLAEFRVTFMEHYDFLDNIRVKHVRDGYATQVIDVEIEDADFIEHVIILGCFITST